MLIKRGLLYEKIDNCFTDISNFAKAQKIMNKQLEINWPEKLEKIAKRINPLYKEFQRKHGLKYYWTIDQSEWATDVIFKKEEELKKLYEIAVRESIMLYSAKDVMRFMGKKIHGNFKGEITSHYNNRPEGTRIKHRVKSNSVKMYDKQGSILRIETTINDPYMFKMYRLKEGSDDKFGIYGVRKSVADVKRRTNISENCNQRYLESIATFKSTELFFDLIFPLCSRVKYKNRWARGLRPWEQLDSEVLKIIGNNDYILNGFRNKDIREKLYPLAVEGKDKKRASSKITRFLWILRAHGLIKKIPKTYKYQLTDSGRKIIPTILKTYNLSMEQLSKVA